MIKLIKIKHLDKWGACDRHDDKKYSNKTLTRWLGGRAGLTSLEVASLRQVSMVDRLWVLERKEILGARLYREYRHACADIAVRNYALKCAATREWAVRWLSPKRTTATEATEAAEAAKVLWVALATGEGGAIAVVRAAWAAQAAAAVAASQVACVVPQMAPRLRLMQAEQQLAWLKKRLREADNE